MGTLLVTIPGEEVVANGCKGSPSGSESLWVAYLHGADVIAGPTDEPPLEQRHGGTPTILRTSSSLESNSIALN